MPEHNSGDLHDYFHNLAPAGASFEIHHFGVPLVSAQAKKRAREMVAQFPEALRMEGDILWVPEEYDEASFDKIYFYVLRGQLPQAPKLLE